MQTNSVRTILFSLVVVVLAGCASGPSFQTQSASMPGLEAGNGRIFFYRKSSAGAAVQPMVRVNDKEVGKAQPKGYFYVDMPPGNYEISASTEAERSLNITLDDGEEKYVRLEIKMGVFVGHIKPVLVDRQEGLEDLQKMKYIGSQTTTGSE